MLGISRWQLLKALAAIVGIVGTVSLALLYFIPSPPSTVIMATGNKGNVFDYYGQQYREIFARFNIKLDLRATSGAEENVKLLQDPESGVQIALVLGGVSDGKRGPGLLSLGTVANSPFWIFYSSKEPFDRLSQLKGKRIAVGPVGSGSRSAAEQILGKGGVNSTTATLLPFAASEAVEALNDGKVDVVWILGAPDAPAISSLLRNPGVRLMNFPRAEGFTRIFPYLVRLVLPQGVIDMDLDIPPNDVTLIGTTAKVSVRNDLHPQIVELLLQAMVEVHGGSNIFQRSGEFPNSTDPEYSVALSATDFYKTGPSLMQRHLPLWLSVHAQRAIAVLLAAIAIGFPLTRLTPVIYQWIMRRRLIYWYGKLKALESSFEGDPSGKHLPQTQIEQLERIEDAVSHISLPLNFTDQLYNLRSHIDIVRRKITSRANAPGPMAAE
jgi:TRAP-type uncharacterized transport system substrate-binding protein